MQVCEAVNHPPTLHVTRQNSPQGHKRGKQTALPEQKVPSAHEITVLVSQAGQLTGPLPINVNMGEILRFRGGTSKYPPILSLPFFLGTYPNFIAKNHTSLLPLHVSTSVYALASNVYTELVDGMRQDY